MDARVFGAMKPFLTSQFGNPSSLHHKGVEARVAVEASRKIIAEIIGARPEEIVFTSGGTESCNLAIFGSLTTPPRIRSAPLLKKEGMKPQHIITTQIEHHAVLEPIEYLKKQGWKVTFLPVDREGFVRVDDVKKAIRKDTRLVSIMYANNEIGSIQPIAEIGKLLNRENKLRIKNKARLPDGQGLRILFYTDACQAAGSLNVNVNHLGVDLMSISASKICGPKGVGFLYARRGTSISPIIHGGGQERGIRSGTENVAGIVGMGKALELAVAHRDRENQRLIGLRDYLIRQIEKALSKMSLKVILNGPSLNDPSIERPVSPKISGRLKMGIRINKEYQKYQEYMKRFMKRLPNNINITVPGVEGEALMLYLDAQGICVSTGSACTTGATDASHVLLGIGRSIAEAKQSIRITLGRGTKKSDLDYFMKALKQSLSLL